MVYFVVYLAVCSAIPHFPNPPILLCLTVDEKENVVHEYCGVNPNLIGPVKMPNLHSGQICSLCAEQFSSMLEAIFLPL